MSRLPLGQVGVRQLIWSNGVSLEGLSIGEGLAVKNGKIISKTTATVQKGDKGDKGEKGDKGDRGDAGSDASLDGARVTSFFIFNETDGKYYEVRCKNIMPDNIPALYLSDVGVS